MSAVSPARTSIRISSSEQGQHHPTNNGEHYQPAAFPSTPASSAHNSNAEHLLRAPLSQQQRPAPSSMEEIPLDPTRSTRPHQQHDPASSVPATDMPTPRAETTTPPAYHDHSGNPSFSAQQPQPQPQNPCFYPPSSNTTPYNYSYGSDPPSRLLTTATAPPSMLAAAITAGGILGLTTAAAVRWLNGGDFTLFPPATMNGRQIEIEEDACDDAPRFTSQPPQSPPIHNNHGWEEAQQSTMKALQTLQETAQAQAQQQDWLWERWQGVCDREDENQPRRRSNDQPSTTTTSTATDILDTLRSIHSELVVLRRQEKYEERLATTLDKLDELLETRSVEKHCPGEENDPERPATMTHVPLQGGHQSLPQHPVAKDHHDHQPLAQAIWTLIQDNDSQATRAGVQLLYLYCVNVSSHPRVPRYRKIFSSNESYQRNVATLTGAHALLEAVGFVPVVDNKHINNSGTTPTAAPDYWEWLPPSIHKKGDDGGDDTKDPGVATSPQHAWLGDSEEFYLQRLKMAAAALSLIKSPTFRKDNDQSELLELFGVDSASALGEPSAVPVSNHSSFSAGEELSVTTPDRSGISFPDDTPAEMNFTPTITKGYHRHPNSGGPIFETPDTGSVLSPPTTKKQLSLNSDFPSLVDDDPLRLRQQQEVLLSQPTLNVLREGDSTSCETSEVSFGGVAADTGAAEAALWK